jgi:cysteine desulfuration protein SufE
MDAMSTVPDTLADIRDDFLSLPEADRLQLLLEFSDELPEMPSEYASDLGRCERVAECQSPVYIAVEVDPRDVVALHATVPPASPTTRGFASILAQGVTGLTADEVLGIPDDYPQTLGLGRAVSPLRLSGMTGMLIRVKRQVGEKRVSS